MGIEHGTFGMAVGRSNHFFFLNVFYSVNIVSYTVYKIHIKIYLLYSVESQNDPMGARCDSVCVREQYSVS